MVAQTDVSTYYWHDPLGAYTGNWSDFLKALERVLKFDVDIVIL